MKKYIILALLSMAVLMICIFLYSSKYKTPASQMEHSQANGHANASPQNPSGDVARRPANNTGLRFIGIATLNGKKLFAYDDITRNQRGWVEMGDKIRGLTVSDFKNAKVCLTAKNGEVFEFELQGLGEAQNGAASPGETKLEKAYSSGENMVFYEGAIFDPSDKNLPPAVQERIINSLEIIANFLTTDNYKSLPADERRVIDSLIDESLKSKKVILSTAERGLKKSDFPAEMGEINDATIDQINEVVRNKIKADQESNPIKNDQHPQE